MRYVTDDKITKVNLKTTIYTQMDFECGIYCVARENVRDLDKYDDTNCFLVNFFNSISFCSHFVYRNLTCLAVTL